MLPIVEQYIALKRPNTRRSYIAVFGQFAASIGGWDNLKAATPADCIAYLAKLKETRAPNTIMQRFQALRGFYEFLADLGEIEKNPWRAAARALSFRQKGQVRPTALIEYDLIPSILASFDHTREGVRNAAIFAMLFGLGLRRSELLGLDVDDIMTAPDGTPVAAIRNTKGGENRLQVIPPWVIEYVLPLVLQRLLQKNGTLICSYSASGEVLGGMSEKTLYRLYRATLKKFGILAAPHSARATFASKLKSQSFEDRDVAEALGHKALGMVKVYDKRSRKLSDCVALRINYSTKKRVANGF